MKILFTQFPLRPAWGGAENQITLLGTRLQKQGWRVRLLSSNSRLLEAFKKAGLAADFRWCGYEPTSLSALLLFPLTGFVASFLFLFEILNTRPQAVFCFSLTDKLVLTLIARLAGCKVVWVEHTRIGRWLMVSPLRIPFVLFANFSTIVAPSFFSRNQLIRAGIPVNRLTVIYPGVDIPTEKQRTGQRQKRRGGPPVLGFLGRLEEEKGCRLLLAAVARLSSKNFHLLIAGAGSDGSALKTLVAQNPILKERVSFSGWVTDKSVFFNKIDILVMPSIKPEAFGLAAVEAMAAGVPVVAARIGALSEIVEHEKTGLLFEPGNCIELIEALSLLQKNPELSMRLIANALRAVGSRFSSEQMFRAYARLLKRITV